MKVGTAVRSNARVLLLQRIVAAVGPIFATAEVLGYDVRCDLSPGLRRTGSIVETPAFYPYLSARDNLRIARFRPKPEHQGYLGHLHGGIVSTILAVPT